MSLTVALTMKTNTPVFSIGFQYIRQLAKFGWKEAISYPKVANLSVQKSIQDHSSLGNQHILSYEIEMINVYLLIRIFEKGDREHYAKQSLFRLKTEDSSPCQQGESIALFDCNYLGRK